MLGVTSPGTSSRDDIARRRRDEGADVREYWLIEPKTRLLHGYRRASEGFGRPELLLDLGRQQMAAIDGVVIDFNLLEKQQGWPEPTVT